MAGLTGGMIYLDANPIIYAVEGKTADAQPARDLLNKLRERPGSAVTSELTLAEVLAPPKRKDAMALPMKRRFYLDLLVRSGFIELKPVSRSVLLQTAELRKVTNAKLADAIHVTTAIQSKCRYFVSNDRGLKLPRGIRMVLPDETGIVRILKEIGE